MLSIYEVTERITSILKRKGIRDSGDYTTRLAIEICKCLNKGLDKDRMTRRLKRVRRADLINPTRYRIDEMIGALVDLLYGKTCSDNSRRLNGGVFPPKTEFRAFYHVIKLVESASVRLDVIDQYPDELTLLALSCAQDYISIRFLTRPPRRKRKQVLFESYGRKLMKDKFGTEIRYVHSGTVHDRFIITERDSWALGHSIKDIGNKLSSISQKTKQETLQLQSIFDALWSNSTPI